MFEKRYKRALVIGAGSGRDIASATLLTEGLRKSGTRVDLAGFLTPWALHTFNGDLERPINRLSIHSRKFIPTRGGEPLGNYFEPLLVGLNEEMGLGLDNIFLFSLHHGMKKLREQLQDLVSTLDYDLIVAADVGGDILAEKKDLPNLMTPIVDISCRKLLSDSDDSGAQYLQTDADVLLAVISPGVDGEIPKTRMNAILRDLQERGCYLYYFGFCDSEEYRTFVEVNEQINRRSDSYSHTFEMIKKMLEHDRSSSVTETYQKRITVGQTTWTISFKVDLELALMDKVFFFDLRQMVNTGCIDGAEYASVLDAFIDVRKRGAGGSEVDCSFVPLSMSNGASSDAIFLLTPGRIVQDEKIRKAILSEGVKLVRSGKIKRALMMRNDALFVGISNGLVQGWNEDIVIIGK